MWRVNVGDFVIAPFDICDEACVNCRTGWTVHGQYGGFWERPVPGEGFADAAQGEVVRVSLAHGTPVVVPGGRARMMHA